jgi:hypothetical protein
LQPRRFIEFNDGARTGLQGEKIDEVIGRAKWLFINPPIVNMNTKPNANNIEGVNLNDPP